MESASLDYSSIGNRIKEVMILSNISVSDFSLRTRVSRFSVAQWLKGKNLTTESICLIANELNVSINWIMFGIGEQQRSSGYMPSETEAEFISICRHINNNCSHSILALLKSLNAFNAASRTCNAYKLTDDFFDSSNTPVAIVQMDGTILDCNPQFRDMLGISGTLSFPALPNIFGIVSSHCVYRLKCDMGVVSTKGVYGYNLYDFKHQFNGKIISIIAKSALIEHGGQLAQEMIFKEAS